MSGTFIRTSSSCLLQTTWLWSQHSNWGPTLKPSHHPPGAAAPDTVIHSRVTQNPLPVDSCGSFWTRSSRTSTVWTSAWTCETLWRMMNGSPTSSLNRSCRNRTNRQDFSVCVLQLVLQPLCYFSCLYIKTFGSFRRKLLTLLVVVTFHNIYVSLQTVSHRSLSRSLQFLQKLVFKSASATGAGAFYSCWWVQSGTTPQIYT